MAIVNAECRNNCGTDENGNNYIEESNDEWIMAERFVPYGASFPWKIILKIQEILFKLGRK